MEKILNNDVGIEILESLKDMKPDLNERDNLSLMLHFVVFDTQRAIFDLVRLKHLGAASALLRVLFESHIKAEWLKVCASEKQIEQFKRDSVKSAKNSKYSISFQEMIADLEKKKPHLKGSLQAFKDYHWKGLNSFTHSGSMQLVQFQRGLDGIEETGSNTIDFANRFAISSLGSVGELLKDINVLQRHISLADRFLGISI
ncbi:hypothetical protein DEB41_17440 [Vibrio anguillarum]|uniref:Uncharacterized protein n=13 Tax=Vibrio anguillarum TaxID=55601 RepID=A0A241NL74_VIBAN|nr:hypothetical protein VAA_00040 [Vibrio anguillarum 775]AGU59925.1 hypothetical protein N175_19115 [Vibrio anguillarum M3]AQP38071.1 hypothetical protein AA909_17145 [Vibrio anguillarum]EGR0320024.1 hypothetical protein [Vibrio cholerae]ASF93648.1 hypothetical protein CEA93_16595 [Vibrio anguillarum]